MFFVDTAFYLQSKDASQIPCSGVGSLTTVVGTVGSGQHMESLGFDTTLETDDAANMQTDTRKLTLARYEETNSPPSPVVSEARIYMSI